MPFSFFVWLAETVPPHHVETGLGVALAASVAALWREVTRYA